MNWNILYDKFGQSLSAAKFEDLSLEYVKDIYKQYEWFPTKRTRDGNKDFHLLENACTSQFKILILLSNNLLLLSRSKKKRLL